MMDVAAVAALVSGFHDSADGEALKSRELILLLLESTAAPFSRDQFTPGHITATGLVLAPDGERVLLVLHRRLDRWLLPGGHVEPEDLSIGAAASREVVEETGATLRDVRAQRLVSIDVHGIPPKKREPYHLHHDLTFLFHAISNDIQVSPESRDVRWCAPGDFDRYGLPVNIRRAYKRSLSTE